MINLWRVILLAGGLCLVVIEIARGRRTDQQGGIASTALSAFAIFSVIVLVLLWVNHVPFPLNLDLMEGTVLQHVQRAADFEAIYPEPSPEYVPLAYNSLYYVLVVPFTWFLGMNLSTLRVLTILGTIGSSAVLFFAVKGKTKSIWWALITLGLFAAAYRVMDVYLDTAHADSWLLFTLLLGSFIIDRDRSRVWNLVGVVVLVSSFWFKQHGALFVVGGVLFLTWREGLKRSLPYWITAAVLGPVLYLVGGPAVFGPRYHYFTWEVPRQWSEINMSTLRRITKFVLLSYPFLALSGGLYVLWTAIKDRKSLNVWHFQLVAAVFSGFMGTLDPGSSDNVYIPMGTLFILVGMMGLHELGVQVELARHYRVHLLIILVAFVLFLYNPLEVMVSPHADESYDELVEMLKGLDGNVYAPSLGQLQRGYAFYPTAHWVALEDMIRGPGRDTRDHPTTRRMLAPAIDPQGEAFILANYPLEIYPWLEFLNEYYDLESDFEERFEPLRVLPARWDHGWPRYLYRYAPGPATSD